MIRKLRPYAGLFYFLIVGSIAIICTLCEIEVSDSTRTRDVLGDFMD